MFDEADVDRGSRCVDRIDRNVYTATVPFQRENEITIFLVKETQPISGATPHSLAPLPHHTKK
jgi:hypothetical protein